MITAKSMIGRPTFYAPNYVNVWFARDSCSQVNFNDIKFPKVVKYGSENDDQGISFADANRKRPLIVKNNVNLCPDIQSSNISIPSTKADSITVDLDSYLGPKNKFRKQTTPKSLSQRRKQKKQAKLAQSMSENINFDAAKSTGEKQFRSKTVEDALEVIENRKKSIKAKLLIKKEHLLTQEEEQDIHTRADLYAITTIPDTKYWILPSEDSLPRCVLIYEEHPEDVYPQVRKKRRRNYGNTNCYVTYHNDDDIFDNTKMLPIGTRLVKPPTKLVELVAQAISGSPDGLLQVQQIYTFLQNRYPFFRYMDRVAINSWRSSIRHALYQKWFRKIRFDSSFISSKGCYWAINNKSNPKEWSLPDNKSNTDPVERHLCMDALHYITDEQETQEVAAIARRLLSTDECPDDLNEDLDCPDQQESSTEAQHNVPSPVKEPDPILSTCTTDWNNEDICISSNESGHGTMTPVNSPSFPTILYLTQENTDCDIRSDLILGTPLNSPANTSADFMTLKEIYSPKSRTATLSSQKLSRAEISPMVNWTPDWEEYGSYIISPHNVPTQKYVHSVPDEKCNVYNAKSESMDLSEEEIKRLELKTMCSLLDSDSESCSQDLNCTSLSDTESCEFEVIAEFPKSDLSSPDLGLGICS